MKDGKFPKALRLACAPWAWDVGGKSAVLSPDRSRTRLTLLLFRFIPSVREKPMQVYPSFRPRARGQDDPAANLGGVRARTQGCACLLAEL